MSKIATRRAARAIVGPRAPISKSCLSTRADRVAGPAVLAIGLTAATVLLLTARENGRRFSACPGLARDDGGADAGTRRTSADAARVRGSVPISILPYG